MKKKIFIISIIVLIIGLVSVILLTNKNVVKDQPVVEEEIEIIEPNPEDKTEIIEEIVPGDEKIETSTEEVIDLTSPDEYKYFDFVYPEEFGKIQFGLVLFEDGVDVENEPNFAEVETFSKRPGVSVKMKYHEKGAFEDIYSTVKNRQSNKKAEIKSSEKYIYDGSYDIFGRSKSSATHDLSYLGKEDGLMRRSLYILEDVGLYILEIECDINYAEAEEEQLNDVVKELGKVLFIEEFYPSDWE